MNTQKQTQDFIYNLQFKDLMKKLKDKESRFFPQFKSGTVRYWTYATPVKRPYGFKTIEECQEVIDKMERDDIKIGHKLCEWRIKEEMV